MLVWPSWCWLLSYLHSLFAKSINLVEKLEFWWLQPIFNVIVPSFAKNLTVEWTVKPQIHYQYNYFQIFTIGGYCKLFGIIYIY